MEAVSQSTTVGKMLAIGSRLLLLTTSTSDEGPVEADKPPVSMEQTYLPKEWTSCAFKWGSVSEVFLDRSFSKRGERGKGLHHDTGQRHGDEGAQTGGGDSVNGCGSLSDGVHQGRKPGYTYGVSYNSECSNVHATGAAQLEME